MKNLIVAAFALTISFGVKAQVYTPVPVSGFNADIVADGIGPAATSTNNTADLSTYSLVAQSYVSPTGQTPSQTGSLPNNGYISSAVTATPGLTFQMAPFTGNNSLRILSATSDTLFFTTPSVASDLFVLWTPVVYTGSLLVNITVNFTDGTNQVFTGITASNWYNGANSAFNGTTRVNRTTNALDVQTTGPRQYQQKLSLNMANSSRLIQSIIFQNTSAASTNNLLNVLAVTSTAGVTVANDAGISGVVAPVTPVPAGISQAVQATLVNQGTSPLTSATITWTVDGVAQTPFAWTGNLAQNQTATVTIGNYTFVHGSPAINVCATNPNNTTDGFAANDCFQVNLNACSILAGTYTIDKNAPASLTNFVSLNAALTALKTCGISAAVTFNVVAGSGPYTEQLDIPEITGATLANTITFNGNGNTIGADPVSASRAIIKLNGADYITINNFIIATTGTTSSSFGWGVHFMNDANNNTISNNTINIGTTSTVEGNSTGIVFSNSNTSPLLTGNNGNNNIISGNTINGGYNGFTLSGSAAGIGNNEITGNTIKNFFVTGIKLSSAFGTKIENNTITRPDRANGSAFEGISLSFATQNTIISKNRITNTHGSATTLAGAVIAIYFNNNDAPVGAENIVKNNLIYNINNTGNVYGIYNASSDGAYMYHNTINLDNQANNSFMRGFFQAAAATNIKFKNNIVNIVGGTAGTKHALYFGTTTSGIDSDGNNLYVTGGATGSGIGYFTSNRVTMADWRTASGDDANSISVNSLFNSTTATGFTPTNIVVNNISSPVTPAVIDDIYNTTRSVTTPDPGAVEFTIASVDLGAITMVTPVAKSCYSNAEQVTIRIKNWGSLPLDFTITNVAVNVTVSGAITVGLPPAVINTNALNGGQPLAAGDSIDVPVGTVDMSVVGLYTFNASTVVTAGGADVNTTNDAMPSKIITTIAVVAGTLTANQTFFCQAGLPTIALTGNAGGTIQWQQATSATGPFTNIPGATNSTYVPSNALIATSYFQAIISCGVNADTTNVLAITVSNPVVTAAIGDTRCGAGVVNLSATPSAGHSIKWYTTIMGGQPVATGNTYSPNITASTVYYAAATTGGGTFSVGPQDKSFGANVPNGGNTYFQIFDILAPLTIEHVYVYPSSVGNVVLHISNSAGAIIQTFTVPVNSTNVNQKTLIPINFTMNPGTNYRIGAHTGSVFLARNVSGATYPYTLPGIISFTGNSIDPDFWNHVYDIQVLTGCESGRTPVVATINSAPVVNLGADITSCGTTPILLDAGNAGATFQWSQNGTAISGATSQTYSPTTAGTYSVVVTNAGCIGSDDIIVTFGSAPVTPVITVATGSSTTICQGSSVTLTGASTTAGVTYRWSHNGTPITGVTAPTYAATMAGDYRVIATNGACSDSSAVTTVTVNPLPATPVITNNGGVLTSSASTGNQWYLNGNIITGQTGTTFTPTASGIYTVIVTSNGCISAPSNTLNITITGIASDLNSEISVYPNPSEGLVNILVPGGKTCEIIISDLSGRLVKNQVISGKNSKVDLSQVAKGIYLLQVVSEGKTAIRKLVIE